MRPRSRHSIAWPGTARQQEPSLHPIRRPSRSARPQHGRRRLPISGPTCIDYRERAKPVMLRTKLVRLAGRVGDVHLLAVIGVDGVPVEKVSFDGSLDLDTLAAELGVIGRDILRSYQELAVGKPRQLSISVGRWIMLLSFLSRDYSLLVIADRKVGLGKARFELRRARLSLASDLS